MQQMNLNIEDSFGQIFRHKRLFNFLAKPLAYRDGMVICLVGKDAVKEIPIDYFKRDWKVDIDINPDEFDKKLAEYPNDTPATIMFNDYFEKDDGNKHTYLYFDADYEDDIDSFPMWKIAYCDKDERDRTINPFTLIMPLVDNQIEPIQKEIDTINELRAENEFLNDEDYQGFEFALIRLLEKKYLRDI